MTAGSASMERLTRVVIVGKPVAVRVVIVGQSYGWLGLNRVVIVGKPDVRRTSDASIASSQSNHATRPHIHTSRVNDATTTSML